MATSLKDAIEAFQAKQKAKSPVAFLKGPVTVERLTPNPALPPAPATALKDFDLSTLPLPPSLAEVRTVPNDTVLAALHSPAPEVEMAQPTSTQTTSAKVPIAAPSASDADYKAASGAASGGGSSKAKFENFRPLELPSSGGPDPIARSMEGRKSKLEEQQRELMDALKESKTLSTKEKVALALVAIMPTLLGAGLGAAVTGGSALGAAQGLAGGAQGGALGAQGIEAGRAKREADAKDALKTNAAQLEDASNKALGHQMRADDRAYAAKQDVQHFNRAELAKQQDTRNLFAHSDAQLAAHLKALADKAAAKGPGGGNPTEAENKAALESSVMIEAARTLNDPKIDTTSWWNKFMGVVPNAFKSGDRQGFETAANNFIEAYGRLISGGAIKNEEYQRFEEQLKPKAGDTPQNLEQKQIFRDAITRATIGNSNRAKGHISNLGDAPAAVGYGGVTAAPTSPAAPSPTAGSSPAILDKIFSQYK